MDIVERRVRLQTKMNTAARDAEKAELWKLTDVELVDLLMDFRPYSDEDELLKSLLENEITYNRKLAPRLRRKLGIS